MKCPRTSRSTAARQFLVPRRVPQGQGDIGAADVTGPRVHASVRAVRAVRTGHRRFRKLILFAVEVRRPTCRWRPVSPFLYVSLTDNDIGPIRPVCGSIPGAEIGERPDNAPHGRALSMVMLCGSGLRGSACSTSAKIVPEVAIRWRCFAGYGPALVLGCGRSHRSLESSPR